jgi:hypothetical protein
MPNSIAAVPPTTPRRFMVQLCKHFEHKLPVSQEGRQERIDFPIGTCGLDAFRAPLAVVWQAAYGSKQFFFEKKNQKTFTRFGNCRS